MPTCAPGGATIGAYTQQVIRAAAAALGISDAQLKTDLANGMTLSQIAATKNISETQVRSSLVAKLTPLLDSAPLVVVGYRGAEPSLGAPV